MKQHTNQYFADASPALNDGATALVETQSRGGPKNAGARVAIVLLPGFPMAEYALFASALERVNAQADRTLLQVDRVSEAGGIAPSNCGGYVETSALDTEHTDYDYLFVFADIDGKIENKKRFAAYLSRLRRSNCVIGAVGGAVIKLDQCGLLNSDRLAVHWQRRGVHAELSHTSDYSDKLCETGPQQWTSCGQTSALDLAIHLVAKVFGDSKGIELAQEFVHSRLYDDQATQNSEVFQAALTGSDLVNRAMKLFRENIEQPLTLEKIAENLSVSRRQLERKFVSHCGATPGKIYMNQRLSHARDLLVRTDLTLIEIALASGFGSTSNLSSTYRKKYGNTPFKERQQRRFGTN